MKLRSYNSNDPVWKQMTVKSQIPQALNKVEILAHNLWWTWNNEALELFASMNPDLFLACRQNPVKMLSKMSYDSLKALAADDDFIERMNSVYKKFETYKNVEPDKTRPSVAYFCMEYGFYHVLQIYSGGLGILAGDYLKQASDSNVDLCGVGFLYR